MGDIGSSVGVIALTTEMELKTETKVGYNPACYIYDFLQRIVVVIIVLPQIYLLKHHLLYIWESWFNLVNILGVGGNEIDSSFLFSELDKHM